MISREEVLSLKERKATSDGATLSVYLDTDKSKEPNIERGFEVVLKNMLRELKQPLDKKQREQFDVPARRVVDYLEEYRDVQRALVLFCNGSDDLFWTRPLNVNVRNFASWGATPNVRPLLEIIDEHERYGVVLADRQQARLFTVYLGEVEEIHQAVSDLPVERIKSPGQELSWSETKLQHKADQHAHLHFKHVAEMMSRLTKLREFDRLIVAGTVEATNELVRLLPIALRTRIVRIVQLPIEASPRQVFEVTLPIEQEFERRREAELVESLITSAKKERKGVLGLEDTLIALQEYRIMELVYADGFRATGRQCKNCGALMTGDVAACIYCGGDVRSVDDLVELANAKVLEKEGKVDEVRGEAANRLKQEGQIGALLRY